MLISCEDCSRSTHADGGPKCSECRKIADLTKRLEEDEEKLKLADDLGLEFGMMKTSDKPEPWLCHTFRGGSELHRLQEEMSENIFNNHRAEAAESRIAELEAERQAYRDNYEATIKQLKRVWKGCDTVGLAYIATDVVNNYATLQAQVKGLEAERGELRKAQKSLANSYNELSASHEGLREALQSAHVCVEGVVALFELGDVGTASIVAAKRTLEIVEQALKGEE